MTDLGQRYMQLMLELFATRSARGGRLAPEEESRRAEELDVLWRLMSADEKNELDTLIADNKALELAWKHETEAPVSYSNWKACERGAPSKGGYEVHLYSDAWFTGEIKKFGPYRVFNLVRVVDDTRLPALCLRIEQHQQLGLRRAPTNEAGVHQTDAARFTGTSLPDEIAALLSLIHGARIAAGGDVRQFTPGDDPRGQPGVDRYRPPAIVPHDRHSGIRVPVAMEKKPLSDDLLQSYASLEPETAVALVRAARAYRDGLWVAESDPALAWLLLISALETAAVKAVMDADPPEVVLRAAAPKLVALLEEASAELPSKIAPELAPLLKATGRFIKFVVKFAPPAPSVRPTEFAQFRWSKTRLSEAMSEIYGLRSDALHESVPFPPPMSAAVQKFGDGYQERPLGFASGDATSWWASKDLPMNLHLFEYITRNVLLKWWRSVLPAA